MDKAIRQLVALRRFPDWVCQKCGATGTSDTIPHSYRARCPHCKEDECQPYSGPSKQFPYVRAHQGHYEFLHPHERQWRYWFGNVPTKFEQCYVVNSELDMESCTVLEVAEGLKKLIDRYLYNSDKKKIAELVVWLEEHEEEHERAQIEWECEDAEWRLWTVYQEVERLRTITENQD